LNPKDVNSSLALAAVFDPQKDMSMNLPSIVLDSMKIDSIYEPAMESQKAKKMCGSMQEDPRLKLNLKLNLASQRVV
jgi:hypothetical protein